MTGTVQFMFSLNV